MLYKHFMDYIYNLLKKCLDDNDSKTTQNWTKFNIHLIFLIGENNLINLIIKIIFYNRYIKYENV